MIQPQTEAYSNIHSVLQRSEWIARKNDHEEQISGLIDDYLKRRQHQQKDPVVDFLFEYYAFRPSHLKRWTPGFGVFLKDATQGDDIELSELTFFESGACLDPALVPENRTSGIEWTLHMLEQSAQKKPSFGCFGMHEWAMVYKLEPEQTRHNYLPLRMDKEQLANFVESRPLICTHFDAYRFFTKPARPMNKYELSRKHFAETEQAGCIHTNMDLYKWAFKLYPWISGKVLRQAFELALQARYIDMKASPYDLSEYGLEPIKIETDQGRLEYSKKQRGLYEKSQPIRQRLIHEYKRILDFLNR